MASAKSEATPARSRRPAFVRTPECELVGAGTIIAHDVGVTAGDGIGKVGSGQRDGNGHKQRRDDNSSTPSAPSTETCPLAFSKALPTKREIGPVDTDRSRGYGGCHDRIVVPMDDADADAAVIKCRGSIPLIHSRRYSDARSVHELMTRPTASFRPRAMIGVAVGWVVWASC
jgi:hypothetical protein